MVAIDRCVVGDVEVRVVRSRHVVLRLAAVVERDGGAVRAVAVAILHVVGLCTVTGFRHDGGVLGCLVVGQLRDVIRRVDVTVSARVGVSVAECGVEQLRILDADHVLIRRLEPDRCGGGQFGDHHGDAGFEGAAADGREQMEFDHGVERHLGEDGAEKAFLRLGHARVPEGAAAAP